MRPRPYDEDIMTTPPKTLIICQVLRQQAKRLASDLRQGGVRAYAPREQYSATSTSKKFRSFGYLALDRTPDVQHGVKAIGHSEDAGGINFVPITSEPPAVTRRTIGRVHKRTLLDFYTRDRRHVTKGRHAAKIAAKPDTYVIGDRATILKGAFEGMTGTVTEIKGKRLTLEVSITGKTGNPVTVKVTEVRKCV